MVINDPSNKALIPGWCGGGYAWISMRCFFSKLPLEHLRKVTQLFSWKMRWFVSKMVTFHWSVIVFPIGSMYSCIFTYVHLDSFYGKCRQICHTWNPLGFVCLSWFFNGNFMVIQHLHSPYGICCFETHDFCRSWSLGWIKIAFRNFRRYTWRIIPGIVSS